MTLYHGRMNQPTHHQIANYLTDYALSELVRYVIEDTGCSIEEAMARVYNSSLATALQDEDKMRMGNSTYRVPPTSMS